MASEAAAPSELVDVDPLLAQDASVSAKTPAAARARIFLVLDIVGAFLSESCQSPQAPVDRNLPEEEILSRAPPALGETRVRVTSL